MNKKSLKNLLSKSSSEARKNGRIGGIKSGEIRRKNKQLRDELLCLLDTIDKNGKSMREKICLSLIMQALKGNVRAFETIRASIGENPTEKVEQTVNEIIDDSVIEKVMDKLKEL